MNLQTCSNVKWKQLYQFKLENLIINEKKNPYGIYIYSIEYLKHSLTKSKEVILLKIFEI